jgi:hypothetical protein
MTLRPVCGAVLAVLALTSCAAKSSTRVTTSSVIEASAVQTNLLTPTGWNLLLPPDVVTRPTLSAQQSLRVASVNPGSTGWVVLSQTSLLLPDRRAGATYVMRASVKTSGVRTPLTTELRLNYRGGSYEFFPGGVVRSGQFIGAIPGTTSDWATVQVSATASKPLVSVEAFPLTTDRPVRFSGTAEIRDVTLRYAGNYP